MNRFDTDNLNAAAARALAEARPRLEAATATVANSLRAVAQGQTIAELKKNVSTPLSASAPKADWVEAYVKEGTDASTPGTELRELELAAFQEKYVAKALNGLLEAADKARESIANLSDIHITSQMSKLRDAHILISAGDYAVEVLKAVNDHDADLVEVTQHEIVSAMRVIFRQMNGSSLTSPEEAKGANLFRDRMMCRMPDFEINSRELA